MLHGPEYLSSRFILSCSVKWQKGNCCLFSALSLKQNPRRINLSKRSASFRPSYLVANSQSCAKVNDQTVQGLHTWISIKHLPASWIKEKLCYQPRGKWPSSLLLPLCLPSIVMVEPVVTSNNKTGLCRQDPDHTHTESYCLPEMHTLAHKIPLALVLCHTPTRMSIKFRSLFLSSSLSLTQSLHEINIGDIYHRANVLGCNKCV